MGARLLGLDGQWSQIGIFQYRKLTEASGADAELTTSYAKTDTPVQYFPAAASKPDNMMNGVIKRIHYRLNFANGAVTYTLRIYQAAIAGDYESNMNMLWESPAARVDDTDYDVTELDIPFNLALAGRMYYALEWSAASGNIQGFISVEGETSD